AHRAVGGGDHRRRDQGHHAADGDEARHGAAGRGGARAARQGDHLRGRAAGGGEAGAGGAADRGGAGGAPAAPVPDGRRGVGRAQHDDRRAGADRSFRRGRRAGGGEGRRRRRGRARPPVGDRAAAQRRAARPAGRSQAREGGARQEAQVTARPARVQNTRTMPRLCRLVVLVGIAACGSGSDTGGSPDAPPGGTPDAAPADAPTSTVGPGAQLTFESGPVRPLALSPDGTRLYVANIPNGSLDVLRVTPGGLAFDGSTYVGIDPVAVAVRGDGEVWVVNHVSDDVSVVDVSRSPPRVVRTLLVGDEPSDIVFAGPGRARAFVTTAHRGQQRTSPDLAGVPGAGD